MPVPKEKHSKILCVDDLRHAEYYQMQKSFDELYSKSKNNEIFTDLMELILARENILLAYRNIKTNQGSKTAGTDGLTINDIGKLSPEDVVYKVNYILCGSPHGYRPKPVRRKDIPKPNGSLRPLGIPCIWDRLVQQCIKQVMEPICEAKFSDNSYGFRPMRSVENAISKVQNLMHWSNLHYGKSVEYADNRISLFSAQWGKCAVTGKSFEILEDIHCHHKKPKCDGGTDKYANLVLILKPVHRLIHATTEETIQKYLTLLNLNNTQIQKVNKLRELAGNEPIK